MKYLKSFFIMSVLFIGQFLVILTPTNLEAQSTSNLEAQSTSNLSVQNGFSDSGVELTTVLLEQKCRNADNNLYAIDLKLKLRFSNKTKSSILIYKDITSVSRIIISKKVGNSYFREADILQSNYFTDSDLTEKLSLANFADLKEDDYYETEETITVFGRYNENAEIPGSISKGTHVLQIKVSKWRWNNDDTEKIQKKLKEYGEIYKNTVVSEPMNFRVNCKCA